MMCQHGFNRFLFPWYLLPGIIFVNNAAYLPRVRDNRAIELINTQAALSSTDVLAHCCPHCCPLLSALSQLDGMKLNTKADFRWELRLRISNSKITGYPYIPLIDRTYDPKVCARCDIRMLNMKKCTGCKTVHYCCKHCQVADWSSHKFSCDPDACIPLGTLGIPYETIPTTASVGKSTRTS